MKKIVLVLVVCFMVLSTGNAFALKSVRDITADDVANVPRAILVKAGEIVYHTPDYVFHTVRFTLHVLAIPFYWLEQVKR